MEHNRIHMKHKNTFAHSQPQESHETEPLPSINSLSNLHGGETEFLSHSLLEVISQPTLCK